MLRSRIVVAAVAAILLAAPAVIRGTTARAAGPGPGNSWTQAQNTFASQGNCCNGDPHCYSSCLSWGWGPRGWYQGTYGVSFSSSSSIFSSDTDWAMNAWSGQPYNSPAFERQGSCGSGVSICVSAASLPSWECGVTNWSWSGDTIVQATVDLNTNDTYTDGPTTQANTCDLRAVLLHEIGHAIGEGHSAVRSDVMYYAPTSEAIDGDAQAMLKAVYSNNGSADQPGGCGASVSVAAATQVATPPIGCPGIVLGTRHVGLPFSPTQYVGELVPRARSDIQTAEGAVPNPLKGGSP